MIRLCQIERTITCQLSGLQTILYQNFRTMSQIQVSKIAEAKSNILYYDDKEGDRDREREREREREGVTGGTSSTSYRNYNGDTVTHTQSSGSAGRLSYSNVLMSLRRLCNHPYLLLEDVKSIPDELYYKDLVASSGKLSLLHGLLKSLIPKGHKVSHNTSNHCYPLVIFHVYWPLDCHLMFVMLFRFNLIRIILFPFIFFSLYVNSLDLQHTRHTIHSPLPFLF